MPHFMPGINFRLIRIIILILFIPAVVTLNYSPAAAGTDTGYSGQWTVRISGLDGTVCVGDPYMLTATWEPNSDSLLAPLTGPRALLVQASHGSFDHSTERPSTASGTTMFLYTAEKTGLETVKIQLFDRDMKVDAEYATDFEVKKCDYMYTLTARSDFSHKDGVISFFSILKSKGLLTAPDPDNPAYREGRNKTISENLTISHFASEECTINTYEPSYALGFVDAKLVEADNGMGLKLMIGPPMDFKWIHDITINCPENNSQRQTGTMLLTTDKDPWIEQVFPFGEGEYSIKIDLMDKEINNFKGIGPASYTAKLRLERMVRE